MCITTFASARSSSSLARSFVIQSLLAIFTVRFVIPHTHYSLRNGRLISARKQTQSSYEIEDRLCRVQEETCEGNFPQIPVGATAPESARSILLKINLTPCLYSAEKRSRVVDIVSDEVSHVCIHLRILSRFTQPKRARRP